MKAYAVRCFGVYFLVYDATHAKAKGAVARLATNADIDPRRAYGTLRCRRWSAMDRTSPSPIAVQEWGAPGERDPETGARIETPEPFTGAPYA